MTAALAGLLMTTGLVIAAPASVAVGPPTAPTVFPADGATVAAAAPTVTATYSAPYRSNVAASLSVLDTSTGTAMPCTDALRQVSGDEQLRCPLALLHAGDSYTATATAIDRATGQPQTTTWSFTTDLPAVTDETPTSASAATSPHISYDQALDASSTVELFAESASGQAPRTAVDGTPAVTGHDASFTPSATMTDGEYALVVHAVGDGDVASYTDSVDEFFVGTPPSALATAPTITSVVTGGTSSPFAGNLTVTGTAPSDVQISLQIYDPTHPSGSEVGSLRVPTCSTSTCPWSKSISTAARVAGSTDALRAFSTTGSVASTPDHLFALVQTSPAKVTSIDVPDVTSANVDAVPVTVMLPAGVVGARIALVSAPAEGPSQAGPALDVASVDGQVSTVLNLSGLEDGQLSIFASSIDSFGNTSADISATSTKEAVSLALIRFDSSDTEVAAQPFLDVNFNEGIRSDSTLTMTRADGKPVTGDVIFGGDSITFDALGTSTHLVSSSTVTLTLHADANTCPANETTACDDQFSRTWTATVDTTPPPAPVHVRCSPGVVDPSTGLLTVTGESTPGDRVFVGAGPAKGGNEVARTIGPLGPSNGGGLTSWSTTLNLHGEPVDNYQVFATDFDPAGNTGPNSRQLYCGLGAPDTLTLTGLPKSGVVPALGKVVIGGRLTSAGSSPAPLAGRIVKIREFRRPHFDPGIDYPAAKTVRTDSSGNWHATVRLFDSEYLQAWFPGNATYVPVSSWSGPPAQTVIRLPLSVSRPVAGSSSGHATPLVISGHERTRLAGGWAVFNDPVAVLLTRAGHRRTIRAHARSRVGNWSLRLPVPRGRWTLTVTAAPKPGKHSGDAAPRHVRLKFRRT
jgi:hypothetical protein